MRKIEGKIRERSEFLANLYLPDFKDYILPRELSSVLCDDPEGWDGGEGREFQEGGNVYIDVPDSLCCTSETNTAL